MATDRKDFLLNECGDLAIVNGDAVLVGGADQIRQSWLIYIRTLMGEMISDTTKGVPYFQEIFDKHRDFTQVQKYFADATLEVPGVLKVLGVEVREFDLNTRVFEVSVDAIIEGDEQTLFNYQGFLPLGSCAAISDPDYPLSFASCIGWFDAQDLSNLSYNPGVSLVLQNKAGQGYAEGDGTACLPSLVGVSLLGQKRAILFNNTISNGHDEHLAFYDTMAIRPTSADFVVFIVCRMLDDPSVSNFEYGVYAFRGQNDAGTDEECKYVAMKEDGSVPGDPDLIAYQRSGASFTNSKASLTAADPFDPMYMATIWQPWTTNTDFYYNGVSEAGDNSLADRKLDGDGFIGATVGTDRKTPEKFANMLFGEMIIFNDALTADQIEDINSWLAAKWGF